MPEPDQDRVNAILAHLERVWTASRACPVCRNERWTVPNDANRFALVEINATGQMHLRGRAFPVVPVTCAQCGYTILLNAIALGVIEEPRRG